MPSSKAALVAASLAGTAMAAQPGAPEPVAAPMRDLDWGQINILHTTDTHGWHGGHLQESQYSADWGDYISFTHHMRAKADADGVDLLVVDTGDRIEGNGLYDASTPKGKYTSEIFARQHHMDAICTGNHELYQPLSVAREHDVTVPNFSKSYIASNLDYVEPSSGNLIPQAQRWRRFRTPNQRLDIVALGFLFDFDRGANNSRVQRVEDTIHEAWFQSAIRQNPDLFLVIGHVGLRMKEFELIYRAIRDLNWHTPIAFLGGHAHVRDTRRFDSEALAVASGRYMETIGWMSIDGIQKKNKGGKDKDRTAENEEGEAKDSSTSVSFSRRYIDNNLFNLRHHAGLGGANASAFATDEGRSVTEQISQARRELGLDERLGCAPRDLWLSRAPYPSADNLYTWLRDAVLPDVVARPDRAGVPRLALVNTGAMRFDIFKGPFTRDSTFLLSPFTSGLSYIPDVSYAAASRVLSMLNRADKVLAAAGLGTEQDIPGMPDTRYLLAPEQQDPSVLERLNAHSSAKAAVGSPDYDGIAPAPANAGQKHLQAREEGQGTDDKDKKKHGEPPLVHGYTTTDDLGTDGDDAVHAPIVFHAVPNCIQAEIGFPPSSSSPPDRVDLVFNDFLNPYVIPALRFAGGDYGPDDIQPYLGGGEGGEAENPSFTDLLAQWVRENWNGDC